MTKLTDHYGDVGPGWKGLLDRLHIDIAALAPDYEVTQVKEKFGALRIYLSGAHNGQVQALLHAAEAQSQYICEECGELGELGGTYWMKTLCPTHRAENDAKRKARWQ